MTEEKAIELMRQAYAIGIHPLIATDTGQYLEMTLLDIADEWQVDPVEMLAALAIAFPCGNDGERLKRKPGESFGDYCKRLLA